VHPASERLVVDPLDEGPSGYGWGLAAPGDVTGDGIPDLLVGSPAEGSEGAGAVYLLAGTERGFSATPVLSWSGAAGAEAGRLLLAPGDVNGDGHPDLLATDGQPSWSQDTHLHLGTGDPAAPFSSTPDHTFEDLVGDHTLTGPELQAAGDLNGDGYDDVVGCALGADTLHILWGSPDPGGTVESVPVADFGISGGCRVGAGGDLTGDGRPDLALGDDEASRIGVFPGGADGVAREATGWTTALSSTDRHFSFPRHLTIVGDINGDGLDDIAAVGLYFSEDWYEVGYTLLYAGSGAPELGRSIGEVSLAEDVVDAGDLDGDGTDELLVVHELLAMEYAAFVELTWGEPHMAGVPRSERLTHRGRPLEASTAVLAGDLDGDGRGDLVVASGQHGKLFVLHTADFPEPEDTGGPGDSGGTGDTADPDTAAPSGSDTGAPSPEDSSDETTLDTAAPSSSSNRTGAKTGGCSRAGAAPLGLWWGLFGGLLAWRRTGSDP
jgi:hypothetical protein